MQHCSFVLKPPLGEKLKKKMTITSSLSATFFKAWFLFFFQVYQIMNEAVMTSLTPSRAIDESAPP